MTNRSIVRDYTLVWMKQKYVNMADVNNLQVKDQPAPSHEDNFHETLGNTQTNLIEIIELLFFAYRDFISDPDVILTEYGFGRAHHRVIHFVNRNPGMPVSDLLTTLKITKQSLARVLKNLIDAGFIKQTPGPIDRRQRLLYTTENGRQLAGRLLSPQQQRIASVLTAMPPKTHETITQFLHQMIDTEDQQIVADIIRNEKNKPAKK